ncbi:hypothetical protein [Myxococcus qinghaiensis]|uniref:hypothetical protein n=1 Tax=Myxococcus qinghaiensis TaxID=2906758 RepID=UPI0020A74805|nr:hypothetical protein [Myxococcus qinghaiensis]MCP3162260.1 hypothetical protein [Myxococcus qinghaiensis]
MRRFATPGLFFALLLSCATTSREEPAQVPASASECPTHKLDFTQETGCRNDGSVEFCLPTGDEALLARVRQITSTSLQSGASRGRVGCNIPEETLYFFPTGDTECVSRHGALTPAAWATLCRIAELPVIRKITPTWYE